MVVPPQVIASQAILSFHVVMLNLFQHLSFQCINLEIPKQVRNDRQPSPFVIASRRRSNLLFPCPITHRP